MKKISKKHYDDYKDLIISEYEAVSRMALSMAERVKELEEPTQRNLDDLAIFNRCMRAAFHAMHKAYVYQINPRYYGSVGAEMIAKSLDNISYTIEYLERDRIKLSNRD